MGRSETAEGEKREIGPLGDSSDVTLADGFTKLLGCRKMQMIVLMFHFFLISPCSFLVDLNMEKKATLM